MQVSAHYDLIREFDIAVPPIELAAFQMIEADLTALNDALYASEANTEENIVRFQKELDAEVRFTCLVLSRPIWILAVPQPSETVSRTGWCTC